MSYGGSALGQTFQYITSIKLHELERQRETCLTYVEDTFSQVEDMTDPILRLEAILNRIEAWKGNGLQSLTTADFGLDFYQAWLQQARHDPSISTQQVSQWVSTLEVQLRQAVTRYDYAKLFGDLLKEWLESGDSLAVAAGLQNADKAPFDSTNAKTERQERIEQRNRIQDLIFEPKHVDVPALESYLTDLFSSPEAIAALEALRQRLQIFGNSMLQSAFLESNTESLIKSLLSSDLLSADKAATLRSFLDNPAILKEVASVLRMQLGRLDMWEWPEEGAFVEMRRQLSGKYRAYMDTELMQALLFHYIGMRWSIAFKDAFQDIFQSKAWKSDIRPLTREQLHRRREFMVDKSGDTYSTAVNSYVMRGRGGLRGRGRGMPRGRGGAPLWVDGQRVDWDDSINVDYDNNNADASVLNAASLPGSIQSQRDTLRMEQFFLTQLPDLTQATADYNQEPKVEEGEKPHPGMHAQQVLLRLVSTEAHLNRALHGSCTIMRADLEWFGPSLPHDSILTVFRFFGMPEKWVTWFEKWLSAKLRFDNSPDVRVRARGVPIAHILSAVCGEAVLFAMDFAVNQRANGLYVYRIYDDFLCFSHSGKQCAGAWREMEKYASLVGITFNKKKTGGVCVGGELEPSLPRGAVAWGFLVFDAEQGRFAVDQKAVDTHIQELKRQLEKPKSIFGYVNALNKYLEFFRRNFGQPAHCFGQVHVDELVKTFERIQRAVFDDCSGSVVEKLRTMVESRFGVKEIPAGWFFLPVSMGGLEVLNPIIQLLSARESLSMTPDTQLQLRIGMDKDFYEDAKTRWMNGAGEYSMENEFLSFQEFTLGRETRLEYWGGEWKRMQEVATGSNDSYWILSLYAQELKAFFGGSRVVEPTLIPVGMLEAFRTAKVVWE